MIKLYVVSYSDHLSGVPLIENCDLLIELVRADVVYDSKPFREACYLKGAKQIISPFAQCTPAKIYEERASNFVERP